MKSLLISLGLLFASPAIAADFSQNTSQNVYITGAPVTVNTLVIPGAATCASQMPYPFDFPYPNVVTGLEVVLNYSWPVAPACNGYGCLPGVTLLANGTPTSFQGAGATSEGLVFTFAGANVGQTLELKLSHGQGQGALWAYFGQKAIIRGSTACQ